MSYNKKGWGTISWIRYSQTLMRYCFLAESTNSSSAILERFQRDSHTQFTIKFQIKPFKFGGC